MHGLCHAVYKQYNNGGLVGDGVRLPLLPRLQRGEAVPVAWRRYLVLSPHTSLGLYAHIYIMCVCVFAHACGIENISLQKKLEHSYNIMYLPVIYILLFGCVC